MPLSYDLPRLATAGRFIVEKETSRRVLLRGINRSGLEYRGPGGEEWLEREFDCLIGDWGANILRIPINQEWALKSAAYLAVLDRAIRLAAERGAYTLVTLQWLDNHTVRGSDKEGRANFVPPLPDSRSIELWSMLGLRYREEPAVMFDILSEPHNPLPGDFAGGRVTMAVWHEWARRLVEAIREVSPEVLIFVSGVNWAYDLRGHPIPEMEGLIYSTHVYRNKGRNWRRAFGDLARTECVFAAEWGGGDGDVEWGKDLAEYLTRLEVGWTAWGWPDRPPLIGPDYAPTRFGALVRGLLRAGREPAT